VAEPAHHVFRKRTIASSRNFSPIQEAGDQLHVISFVAMRNAH
jgi:hypothetical protein